MESSDPEQGNNNNKFLIKLKMPVKLDQEGGSDEKTVQHVTNNTPRVCPQCNKEFGSGKALGGHMRIHAEAIRKKQRRQKSVNQKLKNEEVEEEDVGTYRRLGKKKAACNLCGKNFPSMKSVYGHMRCHPERDWRGIEPPHDLSGEDPNQKSSSEEEEDEDGGSGSGSGGDSAPVGDLLADMPKWGEKGRRGGKGVMKSSLDAAASSAVMVSEEDDEEDDVDVDVDVDDDVDDDEDDDEDDDDEADDVDDDEEEKEREDEEEKEKLRNAVNDLMLLKQVDVSESSGVSTLAAAAVAAQNSRDLNAGLDQHQELSYGNVKFQGSGFEEGGFKEMKRSSGMVEDESDDHLVMEKLGVEEGGSNDPVIKNNAAHVVENHDEYDSKRTELMVMSNGGDGANHKDDNAEMVTGSGKNKKAKKMKLMMDLDQEKPSAAAAGGGSSSAQGGEKYRCSTCNKSFPTHQALGGHRSSHNKLKVTIINANSATNNQSSSVNEETDQKQNHQHQLITSPGMVKRVVSEECGNKKDSTNEGAGSSKCDHSSSIVHQCEVCNKIFPTGQALGGHKRRHWTASADQTDSQPQAQAQAQAPLGMTSSGEEASTRTGGTHIQNMNIDLNLPPPMDDDLEAQGGGGGDDAEHATRLHL